jgi:alpha-mannosidase
MRSARLISYGYVGGYEPGVGSDTGLGLGKKYTLDYALVPHTGDWRAAAPWRPGLEFNNPLIARSVAPHHGELPARWGLLEISTKDVVTSALKSSRDGSTILRVYEAAGRAATGVHVTVHRAISRAQNANLIEDSGAEIDARSEGFSFDLRPFEIKTFKLTLKNKIPAGGSQKGR